eukprot:13724942-Ditylum_brightwellii.AAC.1
MVTFSKPIAGDKFEGNCPQEFKPSILLERLDSKELVKGKYHMYKLHMVPCNASSPTYNLCGHQGTEHQQCAGILHNHQEPPMRQCINSLQKCRGSLQTSGPTKL